MRVDVSEVKARAGCGRKWSFNSRNFFHLRPKEFPKALHFGTVFHTALARMYKGNDIDWILECAIKELEDPKDKKMIEAMVGGYYSGPYQEDKEEYIVIDIESRFRFLLDTTDDTEIAGSIDLVVQRKADGMIFGFEHKTTTNFRPEIYNLMDEQPRVYHEALVQFCEKHNYQFGGIVLNEVRKLTRGFQFNRSLCKYDAADQKHFLNEFERRVLEIITDVDCGNQPYPKPGFFDCQMCEFSEVCAKYGYRPVTLEMILELCGDDFQVRTVDHLEEK